MPIYEFECLDCGQNTEILVASSETELVACGNCGSRNLKKLLSAHAAVSPTGRFPEMRLIGAAAARDPLPRAQALGAAVVGHKFTFDPLH